MTEAPVLLLRWEQLVADLMDRTARFPKSIRFTFTQRIENLALDILAQLIRARFSIGRARQTALAECDILLAQLRALLRMAHERRALDHKGYEHVSRQIDECGRMLGGWRKQAGDFGTPHSDPV
jgi:hypothetical protein